MAYNEGDIKTFNPQKQISTEIVLEVIVRHRDAFKQAMTGELRGVPMDEIPDNTRIINKARALNLIISAQREMIRISRPMIRHPALKKWEKEMRNKAEDEKVSFEEHDNDYNKLCKWLDFLRECEKAIRVADETPSKEDDFFVEKHTPEGVVNVLTENFYEMLEDLEESYEQIYLLMLINKVVSSGIEEDEEMTYKEREDEAIRRIVEA